MLKVEHPTERRLLEALPNRRKHGSHAGRFSRYPGLENKRLLERACTTVRVKSTFSRQFNHTGQCGRWAFPLNHNLSRVKVNWHEASWWLVNDHRDRTAVTSFETWVSSC